MINQSPTILLAPIIGALAFQSFYMATKLRRINLENRVSVEYVCPKAKEPQIEYEIGKEKEIYCVGEFPTYSCF
tara:strand:- start:487 stop:708 length:222 start_codon:yes stop_codon:yes gene_type:complete